MQFCDLEATGEPETFRRGDCNADGGVNLVDPIEMLNFLFLSGQEPPCLDAADTDDSGAIDIADGIGILNYLFSLGDPPPMPGPGSCGPDPTPDELGCDDFAACR